MPRSARRRTFRYSDGRTVQLGPFALDRALRSQRASAARWGKVTWDDSRGIQRVGTLDEYRRHAARSTASGGRPRPPRIPRTRSLEDYGGRRIQVQIPTVQLRSWADFGAVMAGVWKAYDEAGNPPVAEVLLEVSGTGPVGEPVEFSAKRPITRPGRKDPKLGTVLGRDIELGLLAARPPDAGPLQAPRSGVGGPTLLPRYVDLEGLVQYPEQTSEIYDRGDLDELLPAGAPPPGLSLLRGSELQVAGWLVYFAP